MSKISRATRWCPTPEQLIILEELYKGGLRTPKAPIIQKITSHLSLYGNIEGKNVFYWFQNHKARDRKKLRKNLSKQLLFEQNQFFQEHQLQMNYVQTSPFFYPHPHPHTHGFHQQPQHGPAAFLHQSMAKDASSGGYYVWKMDDDLPKSCEAENGLTRTCRNDCVMMGGHVIQRCNSNNRPLQTLDLFPTKSTMDQISVQLEMRNGFDLP